MKSEIASVQLGGVLPEPMSDRRIADWQLEALDLAGYAVVKVDE